MKRHLPFLLMLCIGSTVQWGRSAAAAPLPAGGAAAAGEDREDLADRGAETARKLDARKFDDHDRIFAHDYYDRHRHEDGFRDGDRLAPEFEARIHEGYVLGADMRRICVPAPADLVRGLATAPYGYHYVVVGGHVCLVDQDYRIHDTIHLEIEEISELGL